MDATKTCTFISRTIFCFVFVFLLVAALDKSDHSGHNDHSTDQDSITLTEETTRTPVRDSYSSYISSNHDVSSSTTISDDAHVHHKHILNDQEEAANHDMHHQLHDTHKITANHKSNNQEMVRDQASPKVNKLAIDTIDKHAGHNLNYMRHQGHGMESKDDMDQMDMSNSSDDMHMTMVFHIGIKEVVLFKEWKITNLGEMIGSVIGIAILAVLYEGLKFFREHLFKQYISSMQFSTVAVTGESGRATQIHKIERHRILSFAHAIQTCLHIVQIVISYFLMLIFMTCNVWLCIAVVAGSALGFFIFGWKKATVVDISEHCH